MRVICARPGGRIWECNVDGNVMKTHKFKSAIESEPPTNIDLPSHEDKCEDSNYIKHQINEQLFDLQGLKKSLLLGYTSNAFYIFDIEHSSIVLWTNHFQNIHTIRAINTIESIDFLLFTTDQRVFTFQLNHLEESFDVTIEKESYSNETEIIYDVKRNHDNYINFDNKLKELTVAETKFNILSEEDKILQNLFFIYKSLKVSRFNLKERYAEFFDTYDFHYIKRLLNVLEVMICENDGDVTKTEAKKICAEIYLDYMKIDSIDGLSEELENYVIDCFSVVNSTANGDFSIERCNSCSFPLTISRLELLYPEIADTLVKRLVKLKAIDRLYDIITLVPAVFGFLLSILLDESNLIENEFENIVDIFFASGNQFDIDERIMRCAHLSTYSFWSEFVTRLIRLHNQHTIQCVRCKKLCQIDVQQIQSETFYTYNYAFNKCVNLINSSAALQLCTNAAKYIPCNGIDRNFYIQCLLSS